MGDLPLDADARRNVEPAELTASLTYVRRAEGTKTVAPADYIINELQFSVPLDHRAGAEHITITARVVVGRADATPAGMAARKDLVVDAHRPLMCYLVGGPGSDNPPLANPDMVAFYLDKGFQLVFYDYRGTGSSHELRMDGCRLQALAGDAPAMADFLGKFRQDNMVRDLEAVRKWLGRAFGHGVQASGTPQAYTWATAGQSYGGWLTFTYLSHYPEGLAVCLVTGGVPPIGQTADDVYRRTLTATARASHRFYDAHPAYAAKVHRIAAHIDALEKRGERVAMPGGGTLSLERFLVVGRSLGTSGGDAKVCAGIDACLGADGSVVLDGHALATIEGWLRFEERPLYAVLHEAIYADEGVPPTNWAADRVARASDDYAWIGADPATRTVPAGRLALLAEHVLRRHWQHYKALGGTWAAADLLAQKSDWPLLYNKHQLARNTVPVVALSYWQDIFVDCNLAVATAVAVAQSELDLPPPDTNATLVVANMRFEFDKDLMHTAVKDDPEVVLGRLWAGLAAQVTATTGVAVSGQDDAKAFVAAVGRSHYCTGAD